MIWPILLGVGFLVIMWRGERARGKGKFDAATISIFIGAAGAFLGVLFGVWVGSYFDKEWAEPAVAKSKLAPLTKNDGVNDCFLAIETGNREKNYFFKKPGTPAWKIEQVVTREGVYVDVLREDKNENVFEIYESKFTKRWYALIALPRRERLYRFLITTNSLCRSDLER